MKLVRGTIHDMGILYNSEGKKIRWSYFEALLKVQTEDGLHLGNKVKKDHVFYLKQKMQVNLVTQLLSDSVADAIQFCDEHLHRPEFSNSSATCEFIRIFNALFDVLNSRTIFGKYSKAPMKTTNVKYWKQIFDKAKNYIQALSHSNNLEDYSETTKKRMKLDVDSTVVSGRRKKGFLGFIVNIMATEQIFKTHVETGY